MTPEQWHRVKAVFYGAIELPAAERSAFVAGACGDDRAFHDEIVQLLRQHERDGAFLDAPLGGVEPAALLKVATALEPGQCVGAYRVIEVLGRGGMGIVYRAEQKRPRREVALKVMRPGMASGRLLRRFEAEAAILGRLKHPGIAQIHEAGVYDDGGGGRPFFAMELVDGCTLTEYCDRHGLDTRARLELFARVCDAAHYAHAQGVIHRDLKPANILVTEDGQPKILDFGVSRVTDADAAITTITTSAGQLIGTLPYMSPEQVVGDSADLDARCDVYSLGVICYELLAGRLPHDLSRRSVAESARIIADVDPVPLTAIHRTLRGDVDTIVGTALEKDRERRYQSASELAADIRRHLDDEPIGARRPSTVYRLTKFSRRHKGLVAGLVAAFLALTVGLAGTSVNLVRARAAEREARLEVQKTAAINRIYALVMRSGRLGTASATSEIERRIVAEFSDRPADEAMVRYVVGMEYLRRDRVDIAETQLRRASRLRHQLFGERHPDTLLSDQGLAALNLHNKRYAEAEMALVRVLDVARDVVGAEQEQEQELAISTVNLLRNIYQERDGPDRAAAFCREQIEYGQRMLGGTHRYTLTAMVYLGEVLLEGHRLDQAEAVLGELLTICVSARGESDELTDDVRARLARVAELQRDWPEAVRLRRRIVDIRTANAPPLDPAPYLARIVLGRTLKWQGMLQESEATLQDAVAGLNATPHASLRSRADAMSELAAVQCGLGRWANAEATCRAVFEVRPDVRYHTGRAEFTLWWLLAALRAQGRYDDIRSFFQPEFDGFVAERFTETSEGIALMDRLAEALAEGGFAEQAETLGSRVVEAARRVVPRQHLRILACEVHLARYRLQAGRYAEAEQMLRGVLGALAAPAPAYAVAPTVTRGVWGVPIDVCDAGEIEQLAREALVATDPTRGRPAAAGPWPRSARSRGGGG